MFETSVQVHSLGAYEIAHRPIDQRQLLPAEDIPGGAGHLTEVIGQDGEVGGGIGGALRRFECLRRSDRSGGTSPCPRPCSRFVTVSLTVILSNAKNLPSWVLGSLLVHRWVADRRRGFRRLQTGEILHFVQDDRGAGGAGWGGVFGQREATRLRSG